ncbi:Ubiquinol cytochrome C oxidoreductase, cytochrome C1 subunit [Lysobacter dokdonensis DS-58]|uniref:Ubiquinol cytochrome C oxidoreductase, cytochrome C1 subunit n=2 Tax=Noviluteimonas TaxID=3382693 RepID=A0A0A2WK66_9GAMM|nr:Ubiquinol cytochrome C oxidoreductase, cytochrome C1 subunit [Lysobacter dokdonensis DS-58]
MFAASLAFASEGGNLQQSGARLDDRASLQRGAQLYINYCSGCHSLKYLRYSRMAEDLGLSEDEVMGNLNMSGVKYGETIGTAMTPEHAQQAFGKMPPDLSLIARVRGNDWIYTYLKSFYLDETRPVGWNNTLFPNVSMPNPLWEMQGLQHAVLSKPSASGEAHVERLELRTPGTQSAEQYDQSVRDITAFLAYAGEPAALKRQGLGVWVVLFLAAFTLLAYMVKKEYWKDVH